MSTLQNLVAACQADETQLRQQAQARTENWQPWLAPVNDTSLIGEDPGYDDDFQRIREEVNKLQDGHTEIYAVDSVMSSSQHTYVPFSSFRHKGGMMRHAAPEYYYHTRVRRGPSGLHNTWLILGGEAFDNHTVPEDESLSLTLTGTNGQLPRRALQSTVLDTVMKTTSTSIAVRNLCAPTLPCYPPAQDRFHWRVLSHLGSGFLSMMDNAEVLRGTLALYEWTDSEMTRIIRNALMPLALRAASVLPDFCVPVGYPRCLATAS